MVATENDTVYSLSAQTGSILWSTHLGTPVPVSDIPCPSVVSPVVGITGTPYIDLARNEIFVVAMEQHGFTVQHRLYGLNLFDGSVDLDQDVDPPGSQPLQELATQRAHGVAGADHRHLHRLRRLRVLPRLGAGHPRGGWPDADVRDRYCAA